jgi:parvulin-like peptidyl-prolyl isomerase
MEQCFNSQGLTAAQFREQAVERLTQQRHLDARLATTAQHGTPASSPTIPERFHASHIFLSGHEKDKPERSNEMQAIEAELRAGTTSFEDLARKYSDDERTKLRGGDLGWFAEARMPVDFMLEVKPLEPGQISRIVRTKLGWHLIKLIEKRSAEQPNAASLTEEICAMQRNQQVSGVIEKFLQVLRSKSQITKPISGQLASISPAPIQ